MSFFFVFWADLNIVRGVRDVYRKYFGSGRLNKSANVAEMQGVSWMARLVVTGLPRLLATPANLTNPIFPTRWPVTAGSSQHLVPTEGEKVRNFPTELYDR